MTNKEEKAAGEFRVHYACGAWSSLDVLCGRKDAYSATDDWRDVNC